MTETDVKHWLTQLLADEEGATAIEYGLIAALVCLAAITGMQGIGNSVGNSLDQARVYMENKK